MKTRNTVLLAATLSLLLSGCATTPSAKKLPKWVLHPDSKYSSVRYMTAVGEGDTLRAAEGHAFNRLAGRFKTRVQASERVSDRAEETFGKKLSFEKTSEYLSDIQLETDETLLNVETLEQYHDAKGRVYALVALNRADTAQLYKEKIAENAQRIRSLMGGDPYKLKAYAKARLALALGLANQQLIDRLSIIHHDSATMANLPYELDLLRMRAAQASHSIRFKVSMQGNQSAAFGQQVSSVMTRRGFTESAVSDLRISGTVSIQDIHFPRKDINTVRFQLLLNVNDQLGKTLITLKKDGREAHLSQENARRRAERTVNQLIEKELNARLNVLLDHLAGGES
ncbi:LPP20 family lipoprotein [Verrucomicrobiota bacterium]